MKQLSFYWPEITWNNSLFLGRNPLAFSMDVSNFMFYFLLEFSSQIKSPLTCFWENIQFQDLFLVKLKPSFSLMRFSQLVFTMSFFTHTFLLCHLLTYTPFNHSPELNVQANKQDQTQHVEVCFPNVPYDYPMLPLWIRQQS